MIFKKDNFDLYIIEVVVSMIDIMKHTYQFHDNSYHEWLQRHDVIILIKK